MVSILAFAIPIFAQAAPPAPAPTPAPTTTPARAPTDAMPPQPTLTIPASSLRVVHLDDALRIALQHQPALMQAQAATRAAEGRADQARAGLFPQITASASYQRIHGNARINTSTSTPTAVGSGTFDSYSAGVSGSQLLYDFGQTWDRSRSFNRSVDSFRASERTAEQTSLLNVRRAYFQARAQRALIRVAEDTLANHQKHFEQIEGFVKVGTRPEIDLAQTRADIANDKLSIINAQNGYDIARSQLNQAMGASGNIDFDVAEDDVGAVDGEDLPTDRVVDRAYKNRPELLSLEKQREAQELLVRSARGGYGPTLSANAGASYSGVALDALAPNWNVGATLVWPIFQGGLTKGQVREAEANVDVTIAQMDVIKLQVRFDVEQALLGVRAAKASVVAAEEVLVNQRERLRLAEGRYTAGVGSILELADAQLATAASATQLVQAKYNVSTARANLIAALGLGARR